MKVGDLVRVFDPRACGGLPIGAVGLVLEKDERQKNTPRWTVWWFHNNVVPVIGQKMSETTTYGHGIEVINDFEKK